MDKSAIESQLRAAILRRVGIERGVAITRNSNFSDLGIDSLEVMELLLQAEEEYGIRFTHEAARTFVTVGDVISYIAYKTARRFTA
jgi:acyl carrier protein